MSTHKKDGRANNGAENRGLSEASYLVRGPKELLEAMAERAKALGIKQAEAWRTAAEEFLASDRH